MNRIDELVKICNAAERYRIALMLNNAADYVRSVVVMEVVAAKVQDFDVDDYKEMRESTDRTRSNDHNTFIDSVKRVNAICDAHGVPHVYNGSDQRREYGDFAMELVAEIFAGRN